MTLALDQVVDLDCIASTDPLVLDLPSTERYVTGRQAIAYRVVYAWAAVLHLLELEGSFSRAELAKLRSNLARLAEDEDFVSSASVTVTLGDDGALDIACTLTFDDSTTAALEVTTGEAATLNFEAAA